MKSHYVLDVHTFMQLLQIPETLLLKQKLERTKHCRSEFFMISHYFCQIVRFNLLPQHNTKHQLVIKLFRFSVEAGRSALFDIMPLISRQSAES